MQLSKAQQDAQRALNKYIKAFTPHRTFVIGDKVLLDAPNLKVNTPSKKLSPRRYSPFKIVKQISPVTYRIELPPSMKIHNVFHIDLLIPYHETEEYGETYTQPPPELIDGEEEYEVEEIINSHRKGCNKKLQYLVRWKGYPSSKNSWVDKDNLHVPELLAEYSKA